MPTSDSFRAFFAVPFAPSVTEGLEAAVRERVAMPDMVYEGGWKVVPAEQLHITLKFLGEAPVESTPRLEEALREATAGVPSFPLRLREWGLLPGVRMPRVLVLWVSDPTGTLPRLAALLEERADALGFPREPRPFVPHVTVARRRRGRGRADPRRGDACRAGPPPASVSEDKAFAADTVGRVVLMKSTLGPAGSVYSVVAEALLGGIGSGGQAGTRTGTRTASDRGTTW